MLLPALIVLCVFGVLALLIHAALKNDQARIASLGSRLVPDVRAQRIEAAARRLLEAEEDFQKDTGIPSWDDEVTRAAKELRSALDMEAGK